jgi:predicted N-acyltransferase
LRLDPREWLALRRRTSTFGNMHESKPETVAIRVVSGIGEIRREEWDALANPGWSGDLVGVNGSESGRSPFNPFLSWDFLEALEASGSASTKSGWAPRHLVLEGPCGPAAVMPVLCQVPLARRVCVRLGLGGRV